MQELKAYSSELDDFGEKGIYVDITTKEPLLLHWQIQCWLEVGKFFKPITLYVIDYEKDNT